MYSFIFYQLGKSYEQAREMLLYELNRSIEGYQNAEYQKWNRMRVQTALILQQNTKKKVDPRKIIPLEADRAAPASSKEQFLKDMKFFRRPVKERKVYH